MKLVDLKIGTRLNKRANGRRTLALEHQAQTLLRAVQTFELRPQPGHLPLQALPA